MTFNLKKTSAVPIKTVKRAPFRQKIKIVTLGLILLDLTCQNTKSLPSPIIRVDLQHKLPPLVLKRFLTLEAAKDCMKQITLRAHSASQKMIVTWRVFEDKEGDFLTAVQVEPEGEMSTGGAPTATAMVGEPHRLKTSSKKTVWGVLLQISFSATLGCRQHNTSTKVLLRSDDPSCAYPKTKIKIFSDP